MDIKGDAFGKIYEYFLAKFAMQRGEGRQFFTPHRLSSCIVEMIEPFHGRIFDPACGSGGMFVQSAAFVSERDVVRGLAAGLEVLDQPVRRDHDRERRDGRAATSRSTSSPS